MSWNFKRWRKEEKGKNSEYKILTLQILLTNFWYNTLNSAHVHVCFGNISFIWCNIHCLYFCMLINTRLTQFNEYIQCDPIIEIIIEIWEKEKFYIKFLLKYKILIANIFIYLYV